MDDQLEDFDGEFLEPSEIDWDYEFDASQYYDFTRTESNSEAGEADHWFEVSGNYPPSPLVLKYLGKDISSSSNDAESTKSSDKNADVSRGSGVSQSTKNCKGTEAKVKAKTKSAPKPAKQRSSTLMKPTASHLAKVNNKPSHAQSNYLRGRSHKSPIRMGDRRIFSHNGLDNAATKRQKLEIGFLRKIAQLRHRNSLLHKISTKGGRASGHVAHTKSKVTVPKEPELETQQRAQIRRINAERNKHAELRSGATRARSFNKQMLQAPSLHPPKKGRQRQPEFKVFHLKTMERAMLHSSPNIDPCTQNSHIASCCGAAGLSRSKSQGHHGLKKKGETPPTIRQNTLNNRIFPTKEDIRRTKDISEVTISMGSKISKNQRLSQNPPTESFNKLSLVSDLEDTVSQPKAHLPTKVSKENAPGSFQPEFWKCVGKPNQCGSGRGIPGIAHHPNMNRSLGIR